MKPLLLLLITTLASLAQEQKEALVKVPPRNIVPMEVKQRAQAAAQKVVDRAVRGDYQAALDSMNPDYLKIISRPYGGPEKLKAGLLKQMKDMGKNGVTFETAKALAADIAYEVDYGFEDQIIDGKVVLDEKGKPVQVANYRQWMVFVPTLTNFTYLDKSKEPEVLRKFHKWSFEVAISPKRNENWTFISGNSVNALQLRKLFKFLPQDDKKMQFPPVKTKPRK